MYTHEFTRGSLQVSFFTLIRIDMDLPYDPLGHMRKIIEQSSAYEQAKKHIETIDPLYHYKKNMGTTAYRAIEEFRSLLKYEREYKQYSEAERITDRLRKDYQAYQSQPLSLIDEVTANEWRWVESVRKALKPFNPVSDLLDAAASTYALRKYESLQLDNSLDILTRTFARSSIADRASDDWSNLQRIFRTVEELQAERNDWASNGGELTPVENVDGGSEIVASAVPSNASTDLQGIETILSSILQELRSSRSTPEQKSKFWKEVYPYIFAILLLVVTPIADTYVKRVIDNIDPVQVTQQARQDDKVMVVQLRAKEIKLTSMLLSEIRFISHKTKDLALRKSPRRNAATLPIKLVPGAPVQG